VSLPIECRKWHLTLPIFPPRHGADLKPLAQFARFLL
jgi:hypothetical protein